MSLLFSVVIFINFCIEFISLSGIITRSMIFTSGKNLFQPEKPLRDVAPKTVFTHREGKSNYNFNDIEFFSKLEPVQYVSTNISDKNLVFDNKTKTKNFEFNRNISDKQTKRGNAVTKLHPVKSLKYGLDNLPISYNNITIRSGKFINNTFKSLGYTNGLNNLSPTHSFNELIKNRSDNFLRHGKFLNTTTGVQNNFQERSGQNPQPNNTNFSTCNNHCNYVHISNIDKNGNFSPNSWERIKNISLNSSGFSWNIDPLSDEKYLIANLNSSSKHLQNSSRNVENNFNILAIFLKIFDCVWNFEIFSCVTKFHNNFYKTKNDLHDGYDSSNINFLPTEVIARAKGSSKIQYKWLESFVNLFVKLKLFMLPLITGLVLLSGKALSISFIALIASVIAGSSNRISKMWYASGDSEAVKRHETQPQVYDYQSNANYYMR